MVAAIFRAIYPGRLSQRRLPVWIGRSPSDETDIALARLAQIGTQLWDGGGDLRHALPPELREWVLRQAAVRVDAFAAKRSVPFWLQLGDLEDRHLTISV